MGLRVAAAAKANGPGPPILRQASAFMDEQAGFSGTPTG